MSQVSKLTWGLHSCRKIKTKPVRIVAKITYLVEILIRDVSIVNVEPILTATLTLNLLVTPSKNFIIYISHIKHRFHLQIKSTLNLDTKEFILSRLTLRINSFLVYLLNSRIGEIYEAST